jgi:hypothetical protein
MTVHALLTQISYGRLDRWADHANWDSIALVATGAGTLVLAAGVVIALIGFWDARKTRDGELVIELSQRWNEPETIESKQAYSIERADEIADLIDRLYPPVGVENRIQATPEDVSLFQKLVRWPALIETIGVLRDHGAISSEAIHKMWGYSIASAWETWKDPVTVLRDRASYPGTFRYFQDVAEIMRDESYKQEKRDARWWRRLRKRWRRWRREKRRGD